jgi:hypothetical protein
VHAAAALVQLQHTRALALQVALDVVFGPRPWCGLGDALEAREHEVFVKEIARRLVQRAALEVVQHTRLEQRLAAAQSLRRVLDGVLHTRETEQLRVPRWRGCRPPS